jgi:aminodeoxyfutalosine deaminase
MSQQVKIKGTALFTGKELLPGSQVLILSNGVVVDIVHESQAGDDVQTFNGLLSPGFVNTHCHLELSHMKGVIPEGTGLPVFLTTVMEKRSQQDAQAQEKAMALADAEMKANGIVAVGDISNSTASFTYKQLSSVYYHSFVETMGFVPAFAQSRLDYSLGVLKHFKDGELPCSLVPHAPYSVSQALFELISAIPDNTPITIHNQESAAENSLYQDKTGDFLTFFQHFDMDISGFMPTGTNSLPAWLHWFSKHPLILVHNTFTSEADIAAVKTQAVNAFWCLCPNANLYIEKRLPDVDLLRRSGCTITLGTDSLASNHQLSIWKEVETIRQHYPEISLEEILQWATLNGARALGIADQYGSFEKGKRPGVVLIEGGETRKIL